MIKKNKLAAAQVKIVLVNQISRKKSIFLFSPNLATRLVTYNNDFPHIKLHDPSITWFDKVT